MGCKHRTLVSGNLRNEKVKVAQPTEIEQGVPSTGFHLFIPIVTIFPLSTYFIFSSGRIFGHPDSPVFLPPMPSYSLDGGYENFFWPDARNLTENGPPTYAPSRA